MKIIPKMQRGGSYLPFFAKYTPIQVPTPQEQQESGTKSSNSNSEKGKITEEDLFKTLDKVKGLPNEIRSIVASLQSLNSQSNLLGNTQNLANMYASIMGDIKIAEFNKSAYDESFKLVSQNEGLNEFAVTTFGDVVVFNKDKQLTSISVKEYLKDKGENYRPLTNSHILYMRAHDPSFVQNNEILDIVNNGIGINKVAELIKNRLSSLGTSEQKIEGYSVKQSNQIKGGLEILDEMAQKAAAAGMTVDGLYKNKLITKDQKQQADAALQYIYQTLPENAKAILQLHSGKADNPVQGALEIIGNLILSQQDNTFDISVDYQSELNADGTKRKSSGKGENGENDSIATDTWNAASLLLMGKGQQQVITFNPGTDVSFQCLVNSLPIVDAQGHPIGRNHTLNALTESQYNGVLDFDKAVMGGSKIDSNFYGSIIVNSDKISTLDFPVDANGNPDLRPTTINKKNEADRLIKQAGIDLSDENSIAQNYNKINAILQQVGLNAAYDSSGKIIGGNWKRFAIVNATADGRALGMNDLDENRWLKEITDDSQIDQIINNIKTENNLDKYDFDKNEWYDWNGHDSFYQGTLWIPLIVDYIGAEVGSGPVKTRQIERINQWQTERYIQQNYNKPPDV